MATLQRLKEKRDALNAAIQEEEKKKRAAERKRRDRARYVLGGLQVVRLAQASVEDLERLLLGVPENDAAVVREAVEFERARTGTERTRPEQQETGQRKLVGNGDGGGNAGVFPMAGNGQPSPYGSGTLG